METVETSYIDADDLIFYGVATSFLVWLTRLLMHTPDLTEEAA